MYYGLTTLINKCKKHEGEITREKDGTAFINIFICENISKFEKCPVNRQRGKARARQGHDFQLLFPPSEKLHCFEFYTFVKMKDYFLITQNLAQVTHIIGMIIYNATV